MMEVKGNRVQFFTFKTWKFPWLIHGFSSRWGGVSSGEYRQLNLAGREEKPGNIRQNRALFLRELGLFNPRVFMGEQVHGVKTRLVEKTSAQVLPDTDGIVTGSSQHVLMAFFADCVPLFLVVPETKTVGIVHAGWKGTAGGIAQSAVRFLCGFLDIGPEKILAGLGPAIGPCCYEVGGEVAKKFSEQTTRYSSRRERFFLDLPAANAIQLEEAGLPAANIGKSGFCTSCNPHLFYSHRRDRGVTGRMAGIIAIV